MNVEIARLIGANDGRLPKYTEVGLYPLYYVTTKGQVLCPDCANAVISGTASEWLDVAPNDIIACRVNWDNYDLVDEEGHKIESATLEV